MAHMLQQPIVSHVMAHHHTKYFRTGACAMQGHRPSMEDTFAIVSANVGNQRPGAVVGGVFDGHRGARTAKWAAQELPGLLSTLPHPATARQIANAVIAADAELLKGPHGSQGTTAVLAVCQPDMDRIEAEVTVVSVGDSRCLIWRAAAQAFEQLTEDHKPGLPLETRRILRSGGKVGSDGRVDGGLAVARALGNADYKANARLPLALQRVSPEPSVHFTRMQPGDFLVLGSDGLFAGALTNDTLMQALREPLLKADTLDIPTVPACALRDYLQQSVDKSADNLTLLAMQLLDWRGAPEDLKRMHKVCAARCCWTPPAGPRARGFLCII